MYVKHFLSLLSFLQLYLCAQSSSTEFVSCGSVIKLKNVDFNVRLHSHDVKYGKGSSQQSVTGIELQEDVNSHWVVKAPMKKMCQRGEPIECGSVVRLEHLATNKNLHSHLFQSPLSGYQEISAFGKNGEGDSGDHWKVVCDEEYWRRNKEVMLRHADTSMYLSVSGETYGSPISGQMEVVGSSRMMASHWKAAEGLYIHQNEFNPKEHLSVDSHAHTEL